MSDLNKWVQGIVWEVKRPKAKKAIIKSEESRRLNLSCAWKLDWTIPDEDGFKVGESGGEMETQALWRNRWQIDGGLVTVN